MANAARIAWPAILTLILSVGFTGLRLSLSAFDPLGLATIGTRYSDGQADGSEGYDGQFTYYMAIDPSAPEEKLDAPAYRYQRILLPITAHWVSFGDVDVIPWALLLINTAALTLGTLGLSVLLAGFNRWSGYALIFGLWVGVFGPATLFLHEPLAYALVILGILLLVREHHLWSVAALSAALFAKETTITFWAAALVVAMLARRRRPITGFAVAGSCYLLWQLWLVTRFGQPGLGSGGAMATGFELIPLMGLLRIARVDMQVFGLFAVIFFPTVIVPSLWGLYKSLREFLVERAVDYFSLAIFANAGIMLFLPFSTYREPFGLVRIATGLVLAIIMYAAARGLKRPLNYGLFWIALLVLLVQS